jgi:hypothetical protein
VVIKSAEKERMDQEAIDKRLSDSGGKIKTDFFMAAKRIVEFLVAASAEIMNADPEHTSRGVLCRPK